MISIFLLLIMISTALSISTRFINSINERKNKENINESMYAICSELKYNVSLNKINDELISGSKVIKYDNNLLKDLLNKDLFAFEEDTYGDSILKIELIEKNESRVRLKIQIKYKGETLEQEIIKAEWMDEI